MGNTNHSDHYESKNRSSLPQKGVLANLRHKETIILIHGLGDTREVWSRQVSQLQHSFNVLAYDIRGFGMSPPGDGNGTVRQLADDVAQLISAIDTGPAWLVGFSMGGVIAQQFALDFPHLVKGLVLIASSSKVGKPGLEFFQYRIEQVTNGGLETLARINGNDARGCLSTDDEQMIAEYQRIRTGSVKDPKGYLNACRAMLETSGDGFTESIGAIQHPTLVIAGELDPYCPPKASEMITNAIPRAELITIPAVGHCVHMEAADTTNELITQFIKDNG